LAQQQAIGRRCRREATNNSGTIRLLARIARESTADSGCPDPEDAAPLDADADAPPTPVDEVVESGLMGALSLHAMSMTGKRSSRFRMVVLIRIGTW
jgi:hypothetical protein